MVPVFSTWYMPGMQMAQKQRMDDMSRRFLFFVLPDSFAQLAYRCPGLGLRLGLALGFVAVCPRCARGVPEIPSDSNGTTRLTHGNSLFNYAFLYVKKLLLYMACVRSLNWRLNIIPYMTAYDTPPWDEMLSRFPPIPARREQ